MFLLDQNWICFDFLDRNWLCFDFLDICFDFFEQNWVYFDIGLDLELLLDRRFSVAKLQVLDFQSRDISQEAPRGIYLRARHIILSYRSFSRILLGS